MSILGPYLAIALFKRVIGEESTNSLAIPYGFVYLTLLFSSLLIALFRNKNKQAQLEIQHQYLQNDQKTTYDSLIKALQHQELFYCNIDLF